jgi:pantetheine-phosphate adenylyltransferase
MKHSAIYPGTFDPLTLGHLDLIERAALIFDRVTVAVVISSRKDTAFDLEERMGMARETVRDMRNVEVDSFDGLLVNYARSKGVHVLLRGLRAYSDFEYEFQMALTNRKLAPNIETMFLMPKEAYSTISSSTVREIAEHGGDVSEFVPPAVKRYILRKYNRSPRRLGR